MDNPLGSTTKSLVSREKAVEPLASGRRSAHAVETPFRMTRLVLAALGILSCQSLLDFGPEPTLRSSDEVSSSGSTASTSQGTGGVARGGSHVEVENETTGSLRGGSGGALGATVNGNETTEIATNVSGSTGGSGNGGGSNGGGGNTADGSQEHEVASGGTNGQSNTSGGTPSSTGGSSGESITGYSCSVDVVLATNDCTGGPIQVTQLGDSKGTLRVNMTGYKQLSLRVEVTNPTGYILDIGDSPCVDGGGGDCGWYSNDAELDVQRNADGAVTLSMYASDLISRTNGTVVLGTIPGFFDAAGSSSRTLVLSDGKVCAENSSSCWESSALLRIGALDAENPTPDGYWYIGLNRVVWNQFRDPPREGSGVRKAMLKLQ